MSQEALECEGHHKVCLTGAESGGWDTSPLEKLRKNTNGVYKRH